MEEIKKKQSGFAEKQAAAEAERVRLAGQTKKLQQERKKLVRAQAGEAVVDKELFPMFTDEEEGPQNTGGWGGSYGRSNWRSGVYRREVKMLRNVDASDDDAQTGHRHYTMVVAKFMFTQNQTRNPKVNGIKKIEYINNPTLKAIFESRHEKDGDAGEIVLAWHGTKQNVIEKVVSQGFKIDKVRRTAYGHGLYFSEYSDVSVDYCDGAKMMFLCKVCCSGTKPKKVTKAASAANTAAGYGWALVVEDVSRLLPMYIVTFT